MKGTVGVKVSVAPFRVQFPVVVGLIVGSGEFAASGAAKVMTIGVVAFTPELLLAGATLGAASVSSVVGVDAVPGRIEVVVVSAGEPVLFDDRAK
jgi:hypothetical protein